MAKQVKEIDITSLSDEELDKLLNDVDNEDGEEVGMAYEDTGFGFTDFSPSSKQAKQEPEPVIEEKEEPVAKGEQEAEAANSDETAKAKEEPPEDKSTIEEKKSLNEDKTIQSLYTKIEELENKLRLREEQGNLTQPQAASQNVKPPEAAPVTPEAFFENPDKVIEDKISAVQARRYAENERAIRQFQYVTEQTKKQVLDTVPGFETYVDDIAVYLKDRGILNENLLEDFKKNPYATQNVPALIMLADIAKATRKKSPVAASATVKQQSLSVIRPGKVKPQTSDPLNTITASDIKKLSDEQLDAIINKGSL